MHDLLKGILKMKLQDCLNRNPLKKSIEVKQQKLREFLDWSQKKIKKIDIQIKKCKLMFLLGKFADSSRIKSLSKNKQDGIRLLLF
jgi:hypothetical protein